MNMTLLNRVADIIECQPEHYDQNQWTCDDVIGPKCKTVACIAGHIVHEAIAMKLHRDGNLRILTPIWDLAVHFADLSQNLANIIFAPEFVWPNIPEMLRNLSNNSYMQNVYTYYISLNKPLSFYAIQLSDNIETLNQAILNGHQYTIAARGRIDELQRMGDLISGSPDTSRQFYSGDPIA